MTLLPSSPPNESEIEISVFGRGLGEAIAIHVGGHRWISVDSFAIDGRSVIDLYLESIGFSTQRNLDLVIATHWHDDHIKGLANLFEAATAAEVIVPLAMLKEEFIKFAAAFSRQKSPKFSSGVEEFGKILKIAKDRNVPGTQYPLRMAYNGYMGYRKGKNALPHGHIVTLEALSPSNFDVGAFLQRIAGISPETKVLQRAPHYRQNDVSAAFWLQIGGDAVLLGADLENSTTAQSGWQAVLNAPMQPLTQAGLVKVPHHGGLSGHDDQMWQQLLARTPHAALTPWSRGGKALPTPSDVTRILAFAPEARATGPAVGKTQQQPFTVAKLLRDGGVKFQSLSKNLGHIRYRARPTEGKMTWNVELRGQACPLGAMA